MLGSALTGMAESAPFSVESPARYPCLTSWSSVTIAPDVASTRFVHFAGYINVEDSGMASGQFEGSGDFRWNRVLRDSTVFLTLRESCVWALSAFAAAEAEIVATHL